MLRVLALVGILVCFYAWFGVVIYPPDASAEGRLELPGFTEAAWQLIICLTTANYPDVMLPAFVANRWGGIAFFGSFMVLGFFFLLNLVLATVCAGGVRLLEARRGVARSSEGAAPRRASRRWNLIQMSCSSTRVKDAPAQL